MSTLLAAGSSARARGEFAEAERLLRDALASAERVVPRDAHALAAALNALGLLCKDLARWDEARGHYERALGLLEAADASPHDIATLWHNLGGIAHARGDFVAGEAAARRGLAIRRAAGGGARSIAADEVALAALLDGLGRYDEAERLYRGAIAVFESDPVDELELAVTLGGLGAQYARRGLHADAVRLLGRAVELKRRTIGPAHPDTALTLHNLAVAQQWSGASAEGAAATAEALTILERALGPGHPRVVACRENAGIPDLQVHPSTGAGHDREAE